MGDVIDPKIFKTLEVYKKKASTYHKVAKEEIEREVRIKIKELPSEVEKNSSKVRIIQCMLEEFPGGYIRVRKEIPGKCYFTKKIFNKNIEDSIEISEDIFSKIFKLGYKEQDKNRFLWNGWDIDVLENGEIVAEFELGENQSKVDVPEIFSIVKVLEGTTSV